MTNQYQKTAIIGIQSHLADAILSSEEIENKLAPLYDRLLLPEGRLELMTGIKERRYWPIGTLPSDIASDAAKKLIAKENINTEEIDLLIHASVCRDFLEPATASVVHAKLGLSKHAMAFDLSNACLGMLNAMVIAAQMIERNQIKTALIVGGENSAPLLFQTIDTLNKDLNITRKNIKKYIANLTIGSGACAILLGNREEYPTSPYLTHSTHRTHSDANHLCQGNGNAEQLMMETDSESLLQSGIKIALENWCAFREKTSPDINWAIGHQVGTAHEREVMKALELTNIKTHITYPFLGNTGSVALPITLEQFSQQEANTPEGHGVLLGIGSGLASIFLGVKWQN
jgi:3-oxoacyl-[acyl-carrier-protein] synthase III